MNLKYLANIRLPTERAHGFAIMKMCEQFARLGFAVELIVPDKRDNLGSGDPFQYYRIENNFLLTRSRHLDFLGLTEKWGRLFYFLDLYSFLFALKRRRFSKTDIIYTRDFRLLSLFSADYRLCLEIHELPQRTAAFLRQAEKAQKLIALNSIIKRELVALGLPEEKIFVAGDAVDLEKFQINLTKQQAREQLSLPQDKKVVLYTGHFYKWKGVEVLAQAARILPETFFVFVGGVDPELGEFTDRYGASGNIKIIPFQPPHLMPAYLAAADVLALPNSAEENISSRYTSPLKLFEYMAANRPIVSSDLPSLRETLNEKNSVLVNPDDPTVLAEGIERILSEQELTARITTQALNDVSGQSWQQRARGICDFILAA